MLIIELIIDLFVTILFTFVALSFLFSFLRSVYTRILFFFLTIEVSCMDLISVNGSMARALLREIKNVTLGYLFLFVPIFFSLFCYHHYIHHSAGLLHRTAIMISLLLLSWVSLNYFGAIFAGASQTEWLVLCLQTPGMLKSPMYQICCRIIHTSSLFLFYLSCVVRLFFIQS